MGFRTARKLYQLVFEEDSDLYGLEITARSTTLGERREYLAKMPADGGPDVWIDYQSAFFISHVTDWNLEDESGNPLPITVESLYSIPGNGAELVMAAYVKRTFGRQSSDDLKKESSGGDSTGTTPSTEASLPMEPLP